MVAAAATAVQAAEPEERAGRTPLVYEGGVEDEPRERATGIRVIDIVIHAKAGGR